ncbi:MAG: hypothetical protein HRT80_04905 [Henriciella sp.]|nr:hypothetical protein [Henriciella sp.]
MGDQKLSVEDIEYVADMLRAIAWVKDELGPVSNEAINDLEDSLGSAESALRRIAAEMELTVAAGGQSN